MARTVIAEVDRFGSPVWMQATMNVIGNSIREGNADCAHLARMLPELRRYAEEHGLDWWRDLVEPEASGMPRAFIEHLERGVALLQATGRDGAISRDEAHAAAVAERAQQAQAIAKHGEIGRGRDRGALSTSIKRGETSAAHLTARIARDRPDVLARMKRGEFRSVRQAAIEAGIIDPARQIEAQATRAVRRLTGDALDRLEVEIAARRAGLDKPE
jgi:hypothetical protein